MDNSSFLNFLSVVISALITAAGAVLAAYVSKDRKKRPDFEETIIKPRNYVPPRPKPKWGKQAYLIIFLSLIILTIFTRWILGAYSSNAANNKTIKFASNDVPVELNPILQWDAGSSELSAYTLDGETLTIVAGPHTWPNFPMIDYKQPVTGNFSAQVKVVFAPESPTLDTAQMVGFLVRPANAHLVQGDASFPQDWVVASKYVTNEGILVGCRGSWKNYSSDIVFLKIERVADSWRCAYSKNGENWIWLNTKADNTQLQNQQLVVSLFAYSDTDKAITVRFSDWEIFRNEN